MGMGVPSHQETPMFLTLAIKALEKLLSIAPQAPPPVIAPGMTARNMRRMERRRHRR